MENNRILYLIGAILIGWSITYLLRALPFILFSRKSKELPIWVGKLGNIVSPVIIACLVIYSYSSLEWRCVAPYLAGMLTVILQLLLRNPLTSIIAGTALYMTLLRFL